MKKAIIDYEFVNSETGHIIGYLSFQLDIGEKEQTEQLEKKRAELAIANGIYFERIFWQEKGHGVRST